jgi:hypothetical protein
MNTNYVVTFIGGPANLTQWVVDHVPYHEIYIPLFDYSWAVDATEELADTLVPNKKARYIVQRIAEPTGKMFVAWFDKTI